MTKPTTPIVRDGMEYIRPDNGCYPCDVYGPRCPWHLDEWVVMPEDRLDNVT